MSLERKTGTPREVRLGRVTVVSGKGSRGGVGPSNLVQ